MFSTSTIGLAAVLLATLSYAQNCVITIPPNPLTAAGLATPYKMTGCNQIDFNAQGSFVEATILDPATGALSVYNPLIINQAQNVAGKDFITPVTPTLPANAVVGIWFGSNALTVTLAGDTNGCVNGDGGSIFGQFAYCNAPQFFSAAQTAIAAGLLKVPSPGTITKGNSVGTQCPTVRDFRVIDMDQSDNVDSTYLLINGNQLAQNTPANAKANKNSTELTNGSDNALINDFLAPILGCTPFTAPCITCPGGTSASLAMNELQANAFPPSPPALVPLNDDFVVINNNGKVTQSLTKVNLYRAGVGQPQAATNADASGTTYCQQYAASGVFIAQNQALFQGGTSPAPAVANNLFTFLANRFATSFGPVPSLGCQTIFGLAASPVTQKMDGNGVVISATINTGVLQQILNGQTVAAASSSSAATATTATTAAGKGGKKGANTASTAASASSAATATTATIATTAAGKGGKKGANTATAASAASSTAAVSASSATTATTATTAAGKGGKKVANTATAASAVSTAAVISTSSAAPAASAISTASKAAGKGGKKGANVASTATSAAAAAPPTSTATTSATVAAVASTDTAASATATATPAAGHMRQKWYSGGNKRSQREPREKRWNLKY